MINKDLIKNVPNKPGVYLWKDQNGKIIYIGKAKNLKRRMSQYFNLNMLNSYKTSHMRSQIFSFETIITQSDRSAFILERKLIDEHKPFYNVCFPNTKSFPYIKIKLLKNQIKIEITNSYKKEQNAVYFGPLINNKNYRPLIKYLSHILLAEKGLFVENKSEEFWQEKFEEAKKIINHPQSFLQSLKQKVDNAKRNLDFELAKLYASVIDVLSYNEDNQEIFIKSKKAIDVIGDFEYNNVLLLSIFHYRDGMLISEENFSYEIVENRKLTLSEFIARYYEKNITPDIILTSLEQWNDFDESIKDKFQKPNTNQYTHLMQIALQNAENDVERKYKDFLEENNKLSVQEKLSSLLKIDCSKIVIFDNSFFANTNSAVGVACIYQNGEPNKKMYRHYYHSINTLTRNADVEYMFQTALKFLKSYPDFPTLIFADGNILQINEILKAQKLLGLSIPVYGLIKNDQHQTKTLIDQNGNEILIEEKEIFFFLARMQEEVDRFAKKWYFKKEYQYMIENDVLTIKGIGKKTLENLLNYFGSYVNIQDATLQELKKVVNEKVAIQIFNMTKKV